MTDANLPGGSAGNTVAQLTSTVPNKFYRIVQGNLTSPTISAGQLLLPFPQYSDVFEAEPNDRDSSYQSMQLKVQRRFTGGGTLLASYTVPRLQQ